MTPVTEDDFISRRHLPLLDSRSLDTQWPHLDGLHVATCLANLIPQLGKLLATEVGLVPVRPPAASDQFGIKQLCRPGATQNL